MTSNNGANIRVTIKIIDPSNKLLYIGEEESNAHGEFAFVGPITYEEGIYSIYVGSEITEQGVVNSFKLKKETPTDPTPDPDPKPDLDPSPGTGTTPGTGQISKEQIKEKIENIGNMLENIDEGSIDKEKAVKLLEDIIVQAGRLKADDKNSIKKDLEMIAEKVIIGVSIFDINKLAEDNKNIVISEEDNLKRIEIADSIINEAIQSMEKTYERVKNTLDKNDYNEISSAISKNKAIRFINYADINLSFALTVNSMDVLSEKGIDLVINNVNAKGVSFVIPSEALDSEYIAKYLKKLANTEKTISQRMMNRMIWKNKGKKS